MIAKWLKPVKSTAGGALVAAILLLVPAVCFAQEDSADTASENNQPQTDAEGCEDLAVLAKLPNSVIESCQQAEWFEVSVPLAPDAQGYPREKTVRGSYEFRSYRLLQRGQEDEDFDNLKELLGIAGFRIKYSAKPDAITGRKENTWILVRVSGESYNATVIHSKDEPWTPASDALGISHEMQTNYRAAIYGIQFSEDNQSIVEENSKILFEVLSYLNANPRLAVVVESHKVSEDGTAQNDLEITEKRARTAVAWLEAHGISAKRLQANGLGRSKPISENDTDSEIQRNERIELVAQNPGAAN